TIKINNHPLDGGDHVVAGKRILPGLQLRMANLGFHQVHLAHSALVLLKSRNLPGVRGPKQDGAVALDPTGVVSGIAEILHAVSGKLRLFAAGNVAHPEVEVADECSTL